VSASRAEIEDALDSMDELRRRSSEKGDWTIWAECLSEDVEFHDLIYGEFRGRRAVTDFVVRVHAPFPHLRYERDWSLIDVDQCQVIFQQRMILPEPEGWMGKPFAVDVWSRHRYAGKGLWSLKQDVTLSAEAAAENFRGWSAAGGRFAAPPLAPPNSNELTP
jgi:hypothetical protein